MHAFRKKLKKPGMKISKNLNSRRNDDFKREVSLGTIKAYLRKQNEQHLPLEFYYRDDTSPRELFHYSIDEKYVFATLGSGNYRKFLIEKIRKI